MSVSAPNLNDILAPVKSQLEALNDRLLNEVSPASRALCTILQDVFKSGGKRLRPVLVFLVLKALKDADLIDASNVNEAFTEKEFLVAEISELIHTASLVHDDIIDNSFVRRGQPTTNSKWDNAVTVISGDFLFARAAVNLGKVENTEIVSIYASVLEDLCDGEIQQVEKKFDTSLDWDYYFSKTYKKTASLFKASTKAPVALYELSEELKQAFATYGDKLGMAFQIMDDVLDYTSDEETLGKPVANDLREGQVTMPVMLAQETLVKTNPEAAEDFVAKIEALSCTEEKSAEQEALMQSLLAYIEQTKSVSQTLERASVFVREAQQALKIVPDCQAKQALLDLADFVVERDT